MERRQNSGLSMLVLWIAGALALFGCTSEEEGTPGGGGGSTTTAGNGASAGISGGEAGTSGGEAGTSGGEGQAGTSGGEGQAGTSGGEGQAGTGGSGDTGCGLGLAAPEKGFQVCSVGTTIAAGEDTEYCEVVTLPGTKDDVYYVGRMETKMTNFSHHLIITSAAPGSSNEADMPDGKRVKCFSAESAFGDGLSGVTGSQRPYSDSAYPEGVGKIYYGGQKLVFDYHYFNTSDEDVPARAALNMHLVDKDDVQHIARQFGMYNFSINIPSGQSAGFEKSCRFSHDVMVYGITRHTHRWGTDFTVWWDGGPNDGEQVWKSSDWEAEINYKLPGAPLLMKAGTGFKFRCDFDNTTDKTLRFGVTATDEMCILFGTWWKVDETDSSPSRQGCR